MKKTTNKPAVTHTIPGEMGTNIYLLQIRNQRWTKVTVLPLATVMTQGSLWFLAEIQMKTLMQKHGQPTSGHSREENTLPAAAIKRCLS